MCHWDMARTFESHITFIASRFLRLGIRRGLGGWGRSFRGLLWLLGVFALTLAFFASATTGCL